MKKGKRMVFRILTYGILTLGAAFCLVPLFWMVRSSLMNTVEIFMMPPRWFPSEIMWENYGEVLDTLPFQTIF